MKIYFNSIKTERCSLSFETIERLVIECRKRNSPFVMYILEGISKDNESKSYNYFEAIKINEHFKISNKISNPNNGYLCKKIDIVWNKVDADVFDAIDQLEQPDLSQEKVISEATELARACQADTFEERMNSKIKFAFEGWQSKKYDESAFWREQIYSEFLYALANQASRTIFTPYLDSLYKLYAQSYDSILLPCICVSEKRDSPFYDLHLKTILERNPNDAIALTLKTALCAQGNQFEKKDPLNAVWYAKKALEVCKNNYQAMYDLISCDEKKALAYLNEQLEKNPNDVFALTCLGELYKGGVKELVEDNKKSFEYLSRAFELDPSNVYTCIFLGGLYFTGGKAVLKNDVEALNQLTTAVLLNPSNVFINICLGQIYLMAGEKVRDCSKALMYLTKCLDLCPSGSYKASVVNALLGELYRTGGDGIDIDTKKAFRYLSAVLEYFPSNSLAHASLGELYRTGGDGVDQNDQKALFHLTKAIQLSPLDPYAYARLGELYLSGGVEIKDDKKALENISKALELDPSNIFAKASLQKLKQLTES